MNLDTLLQRSDIWRGGQVDTRTDAVSTGFPELDALLPGGGWPRGALTEILLPREGVGALRLVMPALAQLSREERRWLSWVSPPYIPYAPALTAAGVDLARILLIHPRARQDNLWAVEQSLRSGTCSAVLAWPMLHEPSALRRLQLGAEAGRSLGFMFRPVRVAKSPSPAALRLLLDSDAAGNLSVQVLKRRGGWAAGPVIIDSSHAGPLALSPSAAFAPGGLCPH
jgi:hypothetical protein